LSNLLLDTHIWLWGMIEPERLSPRIGEELESARNELWLSPISVWELIILHRKRRVLADETIETWIAKALRARPMKQAPVTFEVAQEVERVELPHRDPADHFLVATARVFDLTLVTADEALIEARAVPTLPNH
jgi:PIN domain nuclease of toxin-antitoxin system